MAPYVFRGRGGMVVAWSLGIKQLGINNLLLRLWLVLSCFTQSARFFLLRDLNARDTCKEEDIVCIVIGDGFPQHLSH